MSYVHKLIEKDEELVGIATLHWIYILKGVGWFFALGGIGWLFDALMTRGLFALSNISGTGHVPLAVLGMSRWFVLFFLATGFILFAFHVLKVIATQIALTDRRIIYKRGLIMVKVEQIDLEEVRGENLDLGWFGRFLGYAYVDLDCRFIGDVKLDAIEQPERFIRALHHLRANTQDALNVMLGKGNTVMPLNLVDHAQEGNTTSADDPNKNPDHQQPAQPEIQPPQPAQPEIQPPQKPTEIPAPPNEPMPNQPPPLSQDQQTGEAARTQDTPYNDRQKMIDQDSAPAEVPTTKGQVQQKAQIQQQAAQVVDQMADQNIAPSVMEKIVEEVTPKIAQEVVRQMEEKGLVSNNDNQVSDKSVDNDLIHVFDDAALTKDGNTNGADNQNRLGHALN